MRQRGRELCREVPVNLTEPHERNISLSRETEPTLSHKKSSAYLLLHNSRRPKRIGQSHQFYSIRDETRPGDNWISCTRRSRRTLHNPKDLRKFHCSAFPEKPHTHAHLVGHFINQRIVKFRCTPIIAYFRATKEFAIKIQPPFHEGEGHDSASGM